MCDTHLRQIHTLSLCSQCCQGTSLVSSRGRHGWVSSGVNGEEVKQFNPKISNSNLRGLARNKRDSTRVEFFGVQCKRESVRLRTEFRATRLFTGEKRKQNQPMGDLAAWHVAYGICDFREAVRLVRIARICPHGRILRKPH